MTRFGRHDCPPAARRQISLLLDGFRAIAGENLLGVYLHGSLAMGCFNPLRSDIDLLIVTHCALDTAAKGRLAALLLDVSQQPHPVELSFLHYAQLHPWRYPTRFDFHYGEDWRSEFTAQLAGRGRQLWVDPAATDPDLAAHITVTQRRGIALTGLPIAAAFPHVPRADYLDSLRRDVLSEEFGLGSAAAPLVYALLNGCRTCAYLTDGEIYSKEEGGKWALAHLPPIYHAVIRQALDAYRNGGGDGAVDAVAAAALAETLRSRIALYLSPPGAS